MNCTLFCLDVLAWVLNWYTIVGKWASATVAWWHQDDPIAIRGGRHYDRFKVVSDRHRAAVAWLYRWCDAPDVDDWIDCVARFGLDGVPAHTLIYWRNNHPMPVVRINVTITGNRLELTAARECRSLPPVARAIDIGDLSPKRMLDLCLNRG
jgi:hypothetical protein